MSMKIKIDKEKRVGGLLLAGGKSSRMGKNKALLRPFAENGMNFLELGFNLLAAVADPCYVSCAMGAGYAGYPCLEDSRYGQGPAGGIAAGLVEAEKLGLEGMMVLACDMPLLREMDLRKLLIHFAGAPKTALTCAYVSSATGKMQMLCAIYRARALPVIEKALESGERALKRIFAGNSVYPLYYGEAEEENFFNCNTPADFATVREAIGRR